MLHEQATSAVSIRIILAAPVVPTASRSIPQTSVVLCGLGKLGRLHTNGVKEIDIDREREEEKSFT